MAKGINSDKIKKIFFIRNGFSLKVKLNNRPVSGQIFLPLFYISIIMPKTNGLIFDATKIEHCTQRIAYQIYEANFEQREIYLAGIVKNGELYAQKIKTYLEDISSLKVHLVQLVVNKRAPLSPVECSHQLDDLKNQSVVVVDDVLNTGSTLMYAVKYLLEVPLAQLNTAVLVNRNHKKYPVKADFKGISLSTNLNEHIEVVFSGNETGVYLS
jgi:pyrimidine operon attenuation protein/uracil phosphoribosyltransferase